MDDGGLGEQGAAAPADTIIGISFDDVFRAQEFLTAARRLASQHNVELLDAVMIAKTPDGKTVVRETTDPGPAQTALTAGLWTGFLGLFLAGPIGWLAGTAVGAGAGAVRAKIHDVGVPDDWVRWFRDAVQPGSFTVVLLVGRYNRQVAVDELERFAGGHLVYANVEPELVQRVREALQDRATGPLTQHELISEPPTGPPAGDRPPDESKGETP